MFKITSFEPQAENWKMSLSFSIPFDSPAKNVAEIHEQKLSAMRSFASCANTMLAFRFEEFVQYLTKHISPYYFDKRRLPYLGDDAHRYSTYIAIKDFYNDWKDTGLHYSKRSGEVLRCFYLFENAIPQNIALRYHTDKLTALAVEIHSIASQLQKTLQKMHEEIRKEF